MRYGSDWPVTASVYQPTPEPNIKNTRQGLGGVEGTHDQP